MPKGTTEFYCPECGHEFRKVLRLTVKCPRCGCETPEPVGYLAMLAEGAEAIGLRRKSTPSHVEYGRLVFA